MSLEAQKRLIQARGGSVKGAWERNSRVENEQGFRDYPNYHIATYLGADLEVRVVHEKNTNPYTRLQSELRTFLTLPDIVIDMGGIIDFEANNYIVYDGNEMDIFPTYYAIKSNNILKVKVGETKPIIGQTSIGQPIYGDVTEIFFEQPCYSTYKSETSYYTEFDSQVNIPMGRMLVVVPYSTNANLLQEGMEFNMLGNRYKIANIDMNYVKNSKGIIELFVEKVQQSSSS